MRWVKVPEGLTMQVWRVQGPCTGFSFCMVHVCNVCT